MTSRVRSATQVFMDMIDRITISNAHWVPPHGKGALYFRPMLLGTGPNLGVGPSPEYTFLTYVSPVGAYFKGKPSDIQPIRLVTSADTHRAAPASPSGLNGVGNTKCAGNYAPTFTASKHAKGAGFNEVLYLDSKHERFVEEAGASNFFCVVDGVVHTPGLGSILPGVTRKTVIQLLREKGVEVVEGNLDIETACRASEVWCTGTGASIPPVGAISNAGIEHTFNDMKVGELTSWVTETIAGIHSEEAEDKWGWVHNPWGN